MSSVNSAQSPRTCKNCQTLKPIDAFRYRADRHRYNVICRPCENHRCKQGIVRPRHIVDKPRKLVDEKPIGEDYKYEMYQQDMAFQAAMMVAIAAKKENATIGVNTKPCTAHPRQMEAANLALHQSGWEVMSGSG